MVGLAEATARLERAVEAARAPGGTDSATAQLELLHQINTQLSTAGEEVIKGSQDAIEAALKSLAQLGPAPPICRSMVNVLATIYKRGARTGLYNTVKDLTSWLSNKSSSPSSIPARCATMQLLAGLCAAHGPAMVSLCLDAVVLLIKLTRAAESPVRVVAWAALAQAYPGTGGVPKLSQEEASKSMKQTMSERGTSAELRATCLRAAAPLALHAEGLWTGDLFDVLSAMLIKALDDPSASVRATASVSLSELLLAALARPAGFVSVTAARGSRRGGLGGGGAKPSLPTKRSDALTPIEAVAVVLSTAFVKTSREVRVGIARAAVGLLHGMRRADLERHAEFMLTTFLGMAAAPYDASKASVILRSLGGTGSPAECVSHILRAGMGERLSERGQHMMANTIAAQVTSKSCNDATLVVGLKEVSLLLLQLGQVADDAKDTLLQGERPLLTLVTLPTRATRLAACQCLWAVAVAFPLQLAPLLNQTLIRLRSTAATASASSRGTSKDATETLLAEAQAVGALVVASTKTQFGGPAPLCNGCLNAAAELTSSGTEPALAAGWALATALFSMPPSWVAAKPRLAKVYAMFKSALAQAAPEVSAKKRDAVEAQLKSRAYALQALSHFLDVMPEQIAAAMVKPITGALLPPNIALLAACRENATKLMNESFRGAYLLFRAYLYRTLVALPSSALTAKVLNVVMPLVVADIVEPANTHAATCTALTALLDPLDSHLAPVPAGSDDDLPAGIAPPEPLRLAASPDAEAGCTWLSELRAPNDAAGETKCLDAAVALFGAVFRLQTSDVRAQLLTHLGNAASKAARDAAAAAKPTPAAGFFGGGSSTSETFRDEKPSALTNICAALLSSIQRLAFRPSKSALRAELSPAFGAVLAPCLADTDPAVRRAAAQAVGLLGQLLGDVYLDSFSSLASAALTDSKAKDEARAAHALALGHLLSATLPSRPDSRPAPAPRARIGVQLLCSLLPSAGAPSPPAHLVEWTLHALGRIAAAQGPDYKPLVGATLSALSAATLAPGAPQTARASLATARLATALATTIAPALAAAAGGRVGQPQAMLYRCRVLVSAACRTQGGGHGGHTHAYTHGHAHTHVRGGAAEMLSAEELLFERQIISLPAESVPPVASTPAAALYSAITHGLASPLAALRIAALTAIGEIATAAEAKTNANPLAVPTGAATTYAPSRKELSRISGCLLGLMDHEPDSISLDLAKHILLRLLHADGPSAPSFWVHALADTVAEGKKNTNTDANSAPPAGNVAAGGFGGGQSSDSEDGDGGWDRNASGLPQGGDDEDEEEARKRQKEAQLEAEESLKWARTLPRWQTRLFAAECARRLLLVVTQPEHFSLGIARQVFDANTSDDSKPLVFSLSELVGVAFTVATARIDAMRPSGVLMLHDIVDKFGASLDPDFEHHLLLEQSHAQIGAALRPCFAPDAPPGLTASGCALLSRYLLAITTSEGGVEVDPVAVRKLLGLLTKMLTPISLAQLEYPALSDAAATVVRTAALRAAAALQQAVATEPTARAELATQLKSALPALRTCWMGLLRDWCALSAASGRAAKGYAPHLYTTAAAVASREHIEHAWPAAFDAVLSLIGTDAWREERPTGSHARDMTARIGAAAAAADNALTSEDPREVSVLSPINPAPESEDFDLLIGLCVHTLAAADARCAAADDSAIEAPLGQEPPIIDACGEEATLCVASLPKLLHPDFLTPVALPPVSMLLILRLLFRISQSRGAPPAMRVAIASLTAHLAPKLGQYTKAGTEDARQILVALQLLAAAPAMSAIPALRDPSALGHSHPLALVDVSHLQALALSLRALSLLPASLPFSDRLPWIPTAFTVVLQAAATPHDVAASNDAKAFTNTSSDGVREECISSINTLVGFCEAPVDDPDAQLHDRSSGAGAAKSRLLAAAGGAALELLQRATEGSPCADLLLKLALRIVGGLPVDSPSGADVHTRAQAALRRMLRPGPQHLQSQQAAHGTLMAFLAACKDKSPGISNSYLIALLPDVAACFHSGSENDRVGAVKVLLLACTLAPPDSMAALFSLALPILVAGMPTDADVSPPTAELSTICQTALTALGGRAPEAFRAAVSVFSASTRARMETSIREAAAKKQRAASTLNPTTTADAVADAKPTIALKMDFGNFGK